MSLSNTLYQALPVSLQNVAMSIYGLSWKQRRFGGIYAEQYRQFKDRESFTEQDWHRYTETELRRMVLHAFNKVPYYRQLWQAHGVTEERLKAITPDTVNILPVLEKDDLRRFGRTTLLSTSREPGGIFFASSGTTGTPTSILFSKPMHQRWSAAFEARIRNWAGLDRSLPRGMIGGRKILRAAEAKPPYYRYNYFEQQVYFSAYHMSQSTAKDYLQGLLKYAPAYMTGYAVSNYLLASFFEKEGLRPPVLQAVITSSEKLTKEMRETFARVYACKTYDSYSGLEACGLISECEHGNMHVSPDVGLLEFINAEGQPAKPGERAELICTGFLNNDQPLIRYRIGDHVRLKDGTCACGRSMPMVQEIEGRDEDVITTPDGRQMVRFHGIFIDMPAISQGQVVQRDLHHYVVNVITTAGLSKDDEHVITSRMKAQLGRDVNVVVKETEQLATGANGKFKAVISELR